MAFAVDEARVLVAESHLEFSLPPAWRDALIQSNGGDFHLNGEDWIIHPVWDDGDRKRMARTANHLVLETEQAKKWSTFPPTGVAIASNGCGDLLVALPGSGSVARWDHEEGLLDDLGNLDPRLCDPRSD